jgi:Fic family protein
MPQLIERVWEPSGPAYLRSRKDAKPFRYQAYVPDRIADLDPLLPASTTAAVEQAAIAARQLDEAPGIEQLEPIAVVLLRAESVASSRIEGLRLSHRRIEEAVVAPKAARRTALEILQNIRAMERAIEIGGKGSQLTIDHLLEVHKELLSTKWDEVHAGRIRDEQNWIGGGNTPRRADFVPPPEELVEGLLQDLVAFSNRNDLSAIAQAAIAHAQFETIHPFVDGNGRAGRALVHIILRRRGLSTRVVPPISVVLAANATRYVQGLTAYRAGRTVDWILDFAEATRIASEQAADLAASIADLRDAWLERAGQPRAKSAPRRIIEGLIQHPILTVESAADAIGGSQEGARLALNRLQEAGVVNQITLGKRNRAWAADAVFDLLDEFDMSMGTLDDETEGRPAPTRHMRSGR